MLKRIEFKSGVNRDQTSYGGRGGYYACDKIRFRSSYPEKLGGWVKIKPQPLVGVCRSAYTFTSLPSAGQSFTGTLLGTNKAIYALVESILINVTPVKVAIQLGTNPISLVTGSSIASVRALNSGVKVGDFVGFTQLTAVGNIPSFELNTDFLVASVIDPNNFTITLANTATSTVSGGGSVGVLAAYIDGGPPYSNYGYGWSSGGWGSPSSWGLSGSTAAGNFARLWRFTNLDSVLLANIRNGPAYFASSASLAIPNFTSLTLIPNASNVPTTINILLVSQLDKHAIAFGCDNITTSPPAVFDPLLIRWSDQDAINNWTPSSTNSAGFYRLSKGNSIVAVVPTKQETLVYTEGTLYAMQFTGADPAFSFQAIAENISIVSSQAVTSANNLVFWMGQDKFYVYSGRVETLGCTLRNHIFDNINLFTKDSVISGTNERWNEIWWFYPSASSNYNDSYVIYNYLESVWYYGTIDRQMWLDSSPLEYPIAADTAGYIYQHENGVDDDVNPMVSYIQTNDFDISDQNSDGEHFFLLKRVIPDVSFADSRTATPSVKLQIRPKNFPGSNSFDEPFVPVVSTDINTYTNQVFIRARARQLAFKIYSDALGVNWQLGACRMDVQPSGKR